MQTNETPSAPAFTPLTAAGLEFQFSRITDRIRSRHEARKYAMTAMGSRMLMDEIRDLDTMRGAVKQEILRRSAA